jgi:hypothetical protein
MEKKIKYIDVHLYDEKDPDAKYLEILNGGAKLAQKERTVFLSFCNYYKNNPVPNILIPDVRRAIARDLHMSSPYLNTIIINLKNKQAILYDGTENYYLNPMLIPDPQVEEITYRIFR